MSADWPRVPLGEVLTHRKEFVVIDDLQPYKRCRVQLHAQGVVLRDEVPGAEIKTKKQQVCRAGEFLVAEIDAKLGGFGIVPPELEGAIVSSHYFLFPVIESRLDRRFLDYFIRTRDFRDQVTAQGSTNYAAIRPSHVLGYTMPLPPLAEQRRIVSRVDAIAARIADAHRLREEADAEATLLPAKAREALIQPIFNCTQQHPLGEVTDTRLGKMLSAEKKLGIAPAPYLRNANIHDDRIELSSVYRMDFLDHELETFRLQAGDILINEGGYGVGRCAVWEAEIQPCYFQKSLHRVRVDNSRISPRFLMHQLIWAKDTGLFDDITKATTFQHLTGVRLKRHPVVIPDIAEQRRIVTHLDALQAKADALRSLQAEASAELDALLPAVLAKAFAGEL